eukprot:TRINITY_DN4479_c0_g1_i1.p1 TRINITY_DN4479_c0_g1~~TRINITY_DN4479_c0_g1_i1.p1  ORF type:complete len:714 (+),score=277.87 TRINITY_DN4479_c0_g1_i1:223-2142(+)
MGVKTVAVFSEADANSTHVSLADESYLIGGAASKDSYLRGDKILSVAKQSGAQAIHPGYGFLSENASFAEQCAKEGIVFIGPPIDAIKAMGSKSASKNIMGKASVPQIPGYHGEDQSLDLLKKEADKIGYPVLIKAVLGGGGKGMRIVDSPDQFEEMLTSARREAMSSFSDDRVLVEKYLVQPRHVEFQVFGDNYGNTVHLNERDCSVQRRHQKVLEEAPAPHMPEELRKKMGEAAVAAAKAVGYVGAGTVEFILDSKKNFYFMEMNTRLQVEHPITELITGVDLVEWQLKIASGQKLPKKQEDIGINGHAFEARIYAENPSNNFLPGTGKLVHLSPPEGEGIRVDTGVRQGDEVSVFYDPMIAKLAVWDTNRRAALNRLKLALDNYHVIGLANNIEFLKKLSTHPEFQSGNVQTGFISDYLKELIPPVTDAPPKALALAVISLILKEASRFESAKSADPLSPFASGNSKRLNFELDRTIKLLDGEKTVEVKVTCHNDNTFSVYVPGSKEPIRISGKLEGESLRVKIGDKSIKGKSVIHGGQIHLFFEGENYQLGLPLKDYNASAQTKGSLLSPMPGRIVKVSVKIGDKVKKGDPLMIMEAMKMEHTIRAPSDGVVESVNYNLNDLVEEKKQLLSIKSQ